jgi:HAD superfamily hydrolase (TIGR01490 family)
MDRRQSEHHRRPAVHQGVEDYFGFLGVDAAVSHHRNAVPMWRKIGPCRAVGDKAREGDLPGILRAVWIEIDDERRAGGRTKGKGCDSAENLVLRRPNGERRHSQLLVTTGSTVWPGNQCFKTFDSDSRCLRVVPIHSIVMQQAAFFDLDKTVIAKSSTLAFGKPLYKAGFLGRKALARMGLAQVMYLLFGADEDQLARARDELLHLIAGWQRDEIEQLVRETLTDVAEPLVYAEALFLIDEHARRGRRVIIISASPEEIVRPIAEHIGVREVIATKVKTDTQGRYLPEVDVYAMGPGKAEAMEELARTADIDLEGSFAYSDSITDLPMLEAVGNPVVVNPEKELRTVAEEREWPMLEFQRPVTVGPAIPRPSPLTGAAVALSAAALAAAVALMKRRSRAG